MSENEVKLPKVGDEVRVCIRPSVRSDRQWMQCGNLLTARQDPGLLCGTIQITRQMTAEENPHGCHTDNRWNGCTLSAYYNEYDRQWRATMPICGLAKAEWSNAWGQQD
jgi:hypothetical protein